jgi:hypothetical protein
VLLMAMLLTLGASTGSSSQLTGSGPSRCRMLRFLNSLSCIRDNTAARRIRAQLDGPTACSIGAGAVTLEAREGVVRVLERTPQPPT